MHITPFWNLRLDIFVILSTKTKHTEKGILSNQPDSNQTRYYFHNIFIVYIFKTKNFCFRLTVPDLKPNIGLFWYFFTEMFEHFRLLFVCAFQINALALYVVPLTLKFKREPALLATVLIALSTIFRSYPCVGDVGFYLALLPMWKHLFTCKHNILCILLYK